MVHVKDKIVSLWLHFWLKRIANKYPDFFKKMLFDLGVEGKAYEIMYWRYVKKRKFKELPQIVFVEDRQVYRIHQKVIDLIIHL